MAQEVLLPPLATITPQDQRGVLWIIATICLSFIYLTFAARAFVRWQRFQPDDYVILIACVLVLAQTSVAYAAVGLGLGHSRPVLDDDIDVDVDVHTVWRLFKASEVLFVIVIFTAKAAVLLTIQKIMPPNMKLRRALAYTFGLVGVLCLACVLGIAINCGSRSLFVAAEGRCSQWPRWTGVAIADAFTDLWGFGLFCWVIWPLQMRTTYKVTATGLLALRLICIAFTGVHAYYISMFEQSDNPAVDVIRPLAWQQVALTYSLLSAMSIALRPFFRDFHSGMGMDVGHLNEDKYGRGSTVHDSFRMNVLSSKQNSQDKKATPPQREGSDSVLVDTCDQHRETNGEPRYETAVFQGARNLSVGDIASHEFIRRDVEYVVTYDAA